MSDNFRFCVHVCFVLIIFLICALYVGPVVLYFADLLYIEQDGGNSSDYYKTRIGFQHITTKNGSSGIYQTHDLPYTTTLSVLRVLNFGTYLVTVPAIVFLCILYAYGCEMSRYNVLTSIGYFSGVGVIMQTASLQHFINIYSTVFKSNTTVLVKAVTGIYYIGIVCSLLPLCYGTIVFPPKLCYIIIKEVKLRCPRKRIRSYTTRGCNHVSYRAATIEVTQFRENCIRTKDNYISIVYDKPKQVVTEQPAIINLCLVQNIDYEIPIKAIRSLVSEIWKPHLVGIGRDARGIRHNAINIVSVDLCENRHLLRRYNTCKENVFDFASSVGGSLKPLECYGTDIRPVATTSHVSQHEALNRRLDSRVNECYLFHGTRAKHVNSIQRYGFRKGASGMLGRGVYFSDEVVKADQYAVPDDDGLCYMILSRVLLGDLVITTSRTDTQHLTTRPPCRDCLLNIMVYNGPSNVHDSLVYTGGLFREFVIYNRHQAYPEFVIKYKRLNNS